jgi:hypothetical protein
MNSGNTKESPRFLGRRGSGMNQGAKAGYRRNYQEGFPSETFGDEQNSEKEFLEREITALKDQIKVLGQKLSKKDKEA